MHKDIILSPHILVYKPQINSIFSLFLRFILIILFIDFIFYSAGLSFLVLIAQLVLNYFVDLIFFSEILLGFYILSILGEEFIDYDSVNLNYWEIDLVIFFRFFYVFFMILLLILVAYPLMQFVFWTPLIFY